MSGVFPVLSGDDVNTENEDEPIARSSCITEGTGAAHTDTQVDLSSEIPPQVAELSTGLRETQRPEASSEVEGSMSTFNNIDDELAYYEALMVRHDKERHLAELHRKVQGKVTHSRSESLEALVERALAYEAVDC